MYKGIDAVSESRFYSDYESENNKKRHFTVMSSSITKDDIFKIKILKSKKFETSVLTSNSNLETLMEEREKDSLFSQYLKEHCLELEGVQQTSISNLKEKYPNEKILFEGGCSFFKSFQKKAGFNDLFDTIMLGIRMGEELEDYMYVDKLTDSNFLYVSDIAFTQG